LLAVIPAKAGIQTEKVGCETTHVAPAVSATRSGKRRFYNSDMNLLDWPYPKTIAHRGAGKLAPENTLAAIRLGVAHGYRACEFDVKLSRDGVPLLLHDDTFDRTTNATGRAADNDWSAIAQIDAGAWHSSAYSGESIPTYAAIAAYCIANDVAVNCEIKPSTGLERETGTAVALATKSLFATSKITPLLSSFSTEALLAVREAAPELPRAHLFQDPLPAGWLARCKQVDAIALDANWKSLTAEIVQHAHDNGLYVACYTCNEISDAERLWSWGVDSVITDAVDRIAFRA
jgi:glycerophosphoryl diester phosphodiesterase